MYVSTALPKFSQSQLKELVIQAKTKNRALGVTGMLVYGDGSIMQVIEGEPSVIGQLLKDISLDRRHKDLNVLLDWEVQTRMFSKWRMGLVRESTSEPIEDCVSNLRSSKDLLCLNNLEGVVGSVMESFIERAI